MYRLFLSDTHTYTHTNTHTCCVRHGSHGKIHCHCATSIYIYARNIVGERSINTSIRVYTDTIGRIRTIARCRGGRGNRRRTINDRSNAQETFGRDCLSRRGFFQKKNIYINIFLTRVAIVLRRSTIVFFAGPGTSRLTDERIYK